MRKTRKLLIPIISLCLAAFATAGAVFAWFFVEEWLSGSGRQIGSQLPEFSFSVAEYNAASNTYVDTWDRNTGKYELRMEDFSFIFENKPKYFRFTLDNDMDSSFFGSIFYYLVPPVGSIVLGDTLPDGTEEANVFTEELLLYSISNGLTENNTVAATPEAMAWTEPYYFSQERTANNPNYIPGRLSDSDVDIEFFLATNISLREESESVFYLQVDYNETIAWDAIKRYSTLMSLDISCPVVFRGYATSLPIGVDE